MTTSFFKTYDQIGKKEDVSDVISNIAPTETPFVTSVGSKRVDNIVYSWQEDDLAAVGANAQLEGADAPAANMTPTVLRTNTTQILSKAVKTSGSSDRMATYGRAKEFAYQLVIKGKELKRDYEYANCGVSQSYTVGSSGVARKFANIFTQIDSGNISSNSGTPRAFTEALLLTELRKLFDVNGDVSVVMLRPGDMQIAAGFVSVQANSAAVRLREYSATDTKIVNSVKMYVSPWDQDVRFVNNRWLAYGESNGSALLYSPSSWKRAVFRDWFSKDLPETGDFSAKMLIGEFGLQHVNQKASALISDLS